MAAGELERLFVIGQNPAVGAPNSRLERKALAQLDWLGVRDLIETETASFWLDSPEVESGDLRPEAIGTEVFLFPPGGHAEKDGTFTNTQRLLQWHEKAVEPPAVGAVHETSADPVYEPLKRGRSGAIVRAGGVLSGLLALVLRLVGARRTAAASSLIGSLLTRVGWVEAGKVSADDPTIPLEPRDGLP